MIGSHSPNTASPTMFTQQCVGVSSHTAKYTRIRHFRTLSQEICVNKTECVAARPIAKFLLTNQKPGTIRHDFFNICILYIHLKKKSYISNVSFGYPFIEIIWVPSPFHINLFYYRFSFFFESPCQ